MRGSIRLILLGACLTASAATYHLDPGTGSMANPGTAEQPWSTLEAVASAGKGFIAGDVLLLRSGHHGSPTIRGHHDVNANHDDGFQSWSVGPGGVGTGVVRGIVLRGNRILNYEDASQAHRGTLQGIGCFDGFFEDWIIENNEILTDHWHGITLGGARNCRIVNNTVVDLNTTSPGPPWIAIGQHKDGTPSSGNVIRNNLATDFSVDAEAAVQDHNLEIRDYSAYFQNYAERDLRLLQGCQAIDAGSEGRAPSSDAAGLPRPLDGDGDGEAAWDIGAHEYLNPTADSDADGQSATAPNVLSRGPVLDGSRNDCPQPPEQSRRLPW